MSSENYQMLAKTFSGLEEVLKEELIAIGATDVEVVVRGVRFKGTKEVLYKANFCCRTALRILRIVGEYKIKNADELYDSIYKIDWSELFDLSQSFTIICTVNSEAFNNSMFISLKAKDAIVDLFKSKLNKRPSYNPDDPDIRIHVHASADSLSVSLDSSGESLHKRGYRVGQNEATMNEVLAAGILKIVGWTGQCDFYDTMCGSGTIPVEAALMARNIPPGMFRKEFAFEKWKDFDAELFEAVYNEDYEKPFEHRVYASDIVNINIKVSEVNAKNAGVLKDIEFKTIDFASYEPQSENGLLIINPPNGERASDRMVVPLFNMIGDQLKKNYAGFKAWVISSSEEGLKSIDLNPTRKIKLHIGPLECSLQLFEVYDGYKKMKRTFDRPQTQSRGGERREGFRSNTDRGEFNPRERSDFKPRDNGDYKSRDRSDFKPRERGEFKPRDNKDFKPSEKGGFKPRENRDIKPRERGEFKPRDKGSFKPREQGTFKPRERGDFKPREQNSFQSREKGDFKSRDNGSFKSHDGGSFKPRVQREQKPRDFGEFKSRGMADFKKKEQEEQNARPKRTRIKIDKSKDGSKPEE